MMEEKRAGKRWDENNSENKKTSRVGRRVQTALKALFSRDVILGLVPRIC
ncbi:hypothetical protein C8J38_105258 [Rhizobium sp. PP-WC-2G-219]|nr:hypothetical protein C8J38_105258 [Rhizobium sp. PP-WC-2G-219]